MISPAWIGVAPVARHRRCPQQLSFWFTIAERPRTGVDHSCQLCQNLTAKRNLSAPLCRDDPHFAPTLALRVPVRAVYCIVDKQPQLRGENAMGSPSSRSRSSSISSSDEAVVDPPGAMWSSVAGNSDTQQHAPSPTGVGAGSAAAGSSDASATSATRRGRVIKKPVRLEEQDPGRQTLPGRNGRADGPAKNAAGTDSAQPGTSVGTAVAGTLSANGKAGDQASGKGRAAAEEPPAPAAGGAERCVARLGTATSSDSVETVARKAALVTGSSSNGQDSVKADKGSSSSSAGAAPLSAGTGSVVRMALPLETRTSGSELAPQGDAEEAGGAGSAAGEPSKKGKGSVRERDRLIVPDPPPERPVGGLGPSPEDTIKEYKRAFDDVREGFVTQPPRRPHRRAKEKLNTVRRF